MSILAVVLDVLDRVLAEHHSWPSRTAVQVTYAYNLCIRTYVDVLLVQVHIPEKCDLQDLAGILCYIWV